MRAIKWNDTTRITCTHTERERHVCTHCLHNKLSVKHASDHDRFVRTISNNRSLALHQLTIYAFASSILVTCFSLQNDFHGCYYCLMPTLRAQNVYMYKWEKCLNSKSQVSWSERLASSLPPPFFSISSTKFIKTEKCIEICATNSSNRHCSEARCPTTKK